MSTENCTHPVPPNEFGIFAAHTQDNQPLTEAEWKAALEAIRAAEPALQASLKEVLDIREGSPICLRCSSERFYVKKNCVFEQVYREENLSVKTPGVVCCECGWQTVANDQIDALVDATKKAYEALFKNETH